MDIALIFKTLQVIVNQQKGTRTYASLAKTIVSHIQNQMDWEKQLSSS